MKVLAINPGSTSTKVAYAVDGQICNEQKISHSQEELAPFAGINDQLAFRRDVILGFLEAEAISLSQLDVVVGRGGILPPVSAGAYEVTPELQDFLLHQTTVAHPSNLGAILAREIQEQAGEGTLALIYDPVSVDQFELVSRISGLKGVPRKSLGHALNMRAVAIKAAEDTGIPYDEATFIVAHLGGGNSISLHRQGRMVDSISDDEGPFAAERTGELPVKEVIRLCYEKTKEEMLRLYKREGGLKSYCGTSDIREIEARAAAGDEDQQLILEAFVYQLAKGVGQLAAAAKGNVDGIILTGGIANSQKIVAELQEYIGFLAPVIVEAGEHEMVALIKGGQRAAQGLEPIHRFKG